MARQSDHNRAEELISAYLDKRVSAEEQSFFERHIASCADCRAQLETTRSMIAALKAMPVLKAPRSFVLPRELARQSAAQPQRSFLSLYPALRLATVIAAMAFAVLFAGDLLINQMSGAAQQPAPTSPGSVVMQAPEQPPTAPQAAAPAPESTLTSMYGAAGSPELPAATALPAARAAMSDTAAMTESTMAMAAPTTTPEATVAAEAANQAQMKLGTTPESSEPAPEQQADSAADQGAAAPAAEAAPAPAIDPLRIIEIALLGLAVVLGIATVVVRRKQA
jgi:hypothetical protein